jgi:excisionase family DNA binding protein
VLNWLRELPLRGWSVADAPTPAPPACPTPLMLRGIRSGCELTGLGERTVWSLINRNALPHRRVGRAVMFVPEEVAAWISAGCPTAAGSADRVRKAVGR